MKYQLSKQKKANIQPNQQNSILDMEASDTDSEEPVNILQFKSDHPGYKYIGLKKMKKIKVPIIYTNAFCDVEDLALGEGYNEIDGQTKAPRETYALKALLLFSPFRVVSDC